MDDELAQKPDAIRRLGEEIFVPHKARRLGPEEFEVVYIDPKIPRELASKLAMVLIDDKCPADAEAVTVYADKQKDKTDIGLSGNLGSGRAIYFGKQFNILGVGKTSLCTSTEAKHSTGNMELVGSLRRVIVSHWINSFSNRAGAHPIVLALKESKQFTWAKSPIPLALLVRVDDGYLDRPSHVEYSPEIEIDFGKILEEYAKIDAEFFAYRYMLGAWSNGNYSLDGRIIDLETISFTKYRGPYKTAGSKRIENFFGYEGRGFVLILKQLAEAKGIPDQDIEERFHDARRKHLAECLLTLLGVDKNSSSKFISRHGLEIEALSCLFETLAKKISPKRASMSLYNGVSEIDDQSLLDVSRLFRSLAEISRPSDREALAFGLLVRKSALDNVAPGIVYEPGVTKDGSINRGEEIIKNEVVITYEQRENFMADVKQFIGDLFAVIDLLQKSGGLPEAREWARNLEAVNHDFPTFSELNARLFYLVEEYRAGKLTASGLGHEVEKLCDEPWYDLNNY